MRRLWKRLLVLCVIFVAAASAFVLYIHFRNEEPEVTLDYQVWGSAVLPVVSAQIGDQRVNILHGYTTEVEYTIMEDTVMPVGENGKLPLTVTCYDTTLESVTWKVTSRDGSETLAQRQVENLTQNHDTAEFTLDLASVLNVDRDYRLELVLEMADGTAASYYTRVRMGENLHAEEMVDYVMSFHRATFDPDAMEQYAVNLENDGTADSGTLADVTIHSDPDQITWGDLAPEEVGELSLSVLEIDGSFGSFYLEYEVQMEDGEGGTDTCLVDEYLSVQWGSERFYLMNYHRTVTELFSPDAGRTADGRLDFGILSEGDVAAETSGDGNVLAFTVAGELWSCDLSAGDLIQVFTFRDEDDGVRSGYRRYGIKILSVDGDGGVTFLVYGYMNRGNHEGELGISCLSYDREENALNELFFLPCAGTYDTLRDGVEKLACLGNDSQVYLLAGDSLYSIDWEAGEVVILADNTSQRNLVVNSSQTAAAWNLGTGSTGMQILYLDDGTSQLMEVSEGDFITPEGFIDDDCVISMGHRDDETVWGALQVNPCYAVVILERGNTEAVRYEYDDIYIASVTVNGGQVVLDRLRKEADGSFTPIDGDTLIQSTPVNTGAGTVLSSRTDETRRRVWYLNLGTDTEVVRYDTPELISYAAAENLNLTAVKDDDTVLRYYGFGEGRLILSSPDAGAAIDAVYDMMGSVIDSRGRLVWSRTSRQGNVQLPVSAQESTGSGDSLKACLKQLLRLGDLSASLLDSMDMSLSSTELMEELFPGQVVNLSGCSVKALLYYTDRNRPVLIQDREGTAILLVGYDMFNVVYFDPTRGTTYRQGQQDAADMLETGEYSFISYLPES